MRNDVVVDAENNRQYLESQLNNTFDPVLKEKIHGMIAMEIEKFMLVNSRAFDVLESAVVPIKRAKPRRVRIVLISVIFGLFGSMAGVFLFQALRDFKNAIRIASMAAREGTNAGSG
jgi:LPS O-antigen subunit length determinant protein (WzzB/FepE family)